MSLRWEALGVKDGTEVGIFPPGIVVVVGDTPVLITGVVLPVVGTVPPAPPVVPGVVGLVNMFCV